MRFCPYAARVHLVLNAKQIRHHTININLQSKPQWFLANSENPQGKVPVLCITDDTNQATLIESLIIMEYLDSKYADVSPQLVPTDALKKAQEFIWINRFQDVTLGFERFDFARIELGLKVFEEELTRRGTVYFGGDTPNILDYAIWPWLPRLNFIPLIFGEDVTFDMNQYPALVGVNPLERVWYLLNSSYCSIRFVFCFFWFLFGCRCDSMKALLQMIALLESITFHKLCIRHIMNRNCADLLIMI